MKLTLCITFLFAVQLCSCQSWKPAGPTEGHCSSGGDYCKERDFYYQGRDHYYPGRGSYSDQDYRDGSWESRHYPQKNDYSYYSRDGRRDYYQPRDYSRHDYSYRPGKESYHQRYSYPQYEEQRYYKPNQFECFSSCKDILFKYPDTPSGFYYITSGPDKFRKVYCEMEKEFCGSRGWEKFYYMDFFKNDSHTCPGSFKKSYRIKPGDMGKMAGKQYYCEGTVNNGCTTAKFYLDDAQYSEICAKIGGYQYGMPTAFKPYENNDQTFMDGVYFSYGKDTKYLWGYAMGSYKNYAGKDQNKIKMNHMCPDVHPSYKGKVPPFVESYYYCDSGAYSMSANDSTTFFYKNRLFEGKDCEFPNYSCMRSGQPWFYRKLPVYFKDYIGMNSCNDDKVSTKDLKMDNIEIYLR